MELLMGAFEDFSIYFSVFFTSSCISCMFHLFRCLTRAFHACQCYTIVSEWNFDTTMSTPLNIGDRLIFGLILLMWLKLSHH